MKLNPMQVSKLRDTGRYHDGNGLMLDVRPTGAKTWVVRLQSAGRRRDYGLGSLKDVSLAEAREKAREYRKLLRSGIDPLEAKQRALPAMPTFRAAAIQVHGEHKAGWRNSKHGAQWLSTLQTYVFPRFGDLPIDKVESGHVRDALAEIWLTKPETARRVRQRVGTVLDFAHGKGWREHPFSMSAVNRSLPKQAKQTGRFEAMPYEQVPDFLARLREKTAMGRLAVELVVLTAARSNEVRGARWNEFDLGTGIWTVPAGRMKAGKEHKVPLSLGALDVLERAKAMRIEATDFVFHGLKRGHPLSDMTLLKVLKSMGLPFTVHGFRSSFRDWVAEKTSVPGEVAEAALAHAITNKVEAAYRRTNYLEKRADLMRLWGAFCSSSAKSNVIALLRV
jgi:integrase